MRKVYGTIMVIGMLIIIGTAGSSDMGIVTHENLRLLVGMVMVIGGFLKGELWNG